MDDLLHFVRHEVAMDGDDGESGVSFSFRGFPFSTARKAEHPILSTPHFYPASMHLRVMQKRLARHAPTTRQSRVNKLDPVQKIKRFAGSQFNASFRHLWRNTFPETSFDPEHT